MRCLSRVAPSIRARGADERGAVFVLASIAVVVAVGAAALSVDIGSIASRKRDVRKVADLAALDVATNLPIIVTAPSPTAEARDVLIDSADRNGLVLASDPRTTLAAVLGEYANKTFTACGAPLGVETIDAATADAAILTGLCRPNAVRATAADVAPRYFAYFAGESVVDASAIAARGATQSTTPGTPGVPGTPGTRDNHATVSAGSFVARAEADTDPVLRNRLLPRVLRGLFGTGADSTFDAISYRGLAASEITLEALRQSLVANGTTSAGTVDVLLDTQLTLDSLLDAAAAANVLQGGDSTATANLDTLASLAAASTTTRSFFFRDVVDIELGQPDATGSARLNVLDLVTIAAQVANGDNLIDIPLASADLPAGIESATVKATIIEPPMSATGPVTTVVTTSQVRFQLDMVLSDTVPVLLLTESKVRLPMVVEAGKATGTITNIFNPDDLDPTQQQVDVHTRTSGAYAGIGLLDDSALRNPLPDDLPQVDMLLSTLATTTSGFRETTVSECEDDLAFVHPFLPGNPGYTKSVGCSALDLPVPLADPVTGIDGSVLGSVLGDTNAAINNALQPANRLIDQLTAAFGITVGGADVTISDVVPTTVTGSPPVPGSPGTTVTGQSGPVLVK